MMRRGLLACLALVAVLGALCLAAGIEWSTPFRPQRAESFVPSGMDLLGGRRAETEGAVLWVEGSDDAERSVLLARNLNLEAADWQYLRVALPRFPATLSLSLIWRSSEHPTRLQRAGLPRPGRFASTVRLAEIDGWRGTISELGLLLEPAAMISTGSTLDRRFAIESMRIESDSFGAAINALATDWTAYRPWGGRSINTGGFELETSRSYSLVWFVALLVLVFGLLLAALGSRRSQIWVPLGVALLLGWLVLDLHQLGQLFWRGDFARQAQQRSDDLQLHHQLAAALEAARPALQTADIGLALVASSLPFHRTYGAFRLLPLPSAAVDSPPKLVAQDKKLALVLVGRGDWQFDPEVQRLRWAGHEYEVEQLYTDAHLSAYRLIREVEPEARP